MSDPPTKLYQISEILRDIEHDATHKYTWRNVQIDMSSLTKLTDYTKAALLIVFATYIYEAMQRVQGENAIDNPYLGIKKKVEALAQSINDNMCAINEGNVAS